MSPIRASLLALCLTAFSCEGGPTSEWPKGADGEDDPTQGAADGGVAVRLDASSPRPVDDCAPQEDAGLPDGGVSDASTPDGSCR